MKLGFVLYWLKIKEGFRFKSINLNVRVIFIEIGKYFNNNNIVGEKINVRKFLFNSELWLRGRERKIGKVENNIRNIF